MKLSKEALLELMHIFQTGLVESRDISEMLRELDLEIKHGIPEVEGGNPETGKLVLSPEYVASHPRAPQWEE